VVFVGGGACARQIGPWWPWGNDDAAHAYFREHRHDHPIGAITGIPLPFVSYGGTFLVACLAAMGLVQSVWVHRINFERI